MDTPVDGDRILILKDRWLDLILSGQKTMEVRGQRVQPGRYWLGSRGLIRGVAVLDPAAHIKTEDEWASLRPQHCVFGRKLPYKKTWGMPISSRRSLENPLPYIHPRGAIGIVIYRRF